MSRTTAHQLLILLSLSISSGSVAHHGVNGHFDVSRETTLSGVVTEVRLVNPHAFLYLDVRNSEGVLESWSCEMGGASLLRRNGWTEETFAPGTHVEVKGNPSRNDPFGCLVQTVNFSDGQSVQTDDFMNMPIAKPDQVVKTLADGTPNLNGNWIAVRQEPARTNGQRPSANAGARPAQADDRPERPARPEGERPARPEGERPQANAERPAQGRGGRGPQILQTEAGIAAGAGFDRQDNPRFHCQTTNIFIDWTFNEQVNNIVQTKEQVILNYGFMEMISRTIHLNMDSHPENLVPSRAGHSIGKWEGDTLVVDTMGFLEGYLAATFNGVKHSDAMHVVERFSLSEDGNTLHRSYVATDPLYLQEPLEGSDSVVRTTFPFQEYGCEDLTQ